MHRTNTGLLACALIALGLAGGAHAACSVGMTEMPVKMVGTRPIATVSLNGTPVTLLVDSGAVYSMLMRSTATDLNLPLRRLPFPIYGLNGRILDARMTTVEHLKLLDGDLPNIDFMVAGNEIGDTALGVIGRDILGAVDTEYDLAHGVVRFVRASADCEHANMAYWAGDTPVSELDLLPDPTKLGHPAIRAKVQVNGEEVTALFDTGARTVVSLPAAHKAGIKDADMKPGDPSWGAGRGKSQSWSADFASVSLGGETVKHNHLGVAEFGVVTDGMLVGVDFFLSHRIYVSSKQQRMYFTYNGGPVFAQNRGVAPAAVADAASASDTLSADEHARRGAASLSRNDLAAALADLDRACAMAPANASFLAIRASIHVHMKHPSLALADLDAALRLAPADVQALLARAALHAEAHARDLAAADLAAADKLLSPQANEHTIIATLHERNQMPERAIPQWTQWIATHPHDIRLEQAYNSRCWDRMLLDRELDMAMKDCEEALDFDSKNFHNLDTRGWLWLRMGQTANARADFDKAIALHKEAGTSLYGRGILRLRAGDAAGAHADFVAARAAEHGIDAMMKDFGLPLAPDAAEATAAAVAVSASASAAAH